MSNNTERTHSCDFCDNIIRVKVSDYLPVYKEKKSPVPVCTGCIKKHIGEQLEHEIFVVWYVCR